MKKYPLTKEELQALIKVISLINMQKIIIDSLADSFRAKLFNGAFKRLGLKKELLSIASVDVNKGELTIEPKKKRPNKL